MKLSHIVLLSAAVLFSFTACDNIDEADRFEGPIGGDNPTMTVKKNVLVEDFTGQKCPNCPIAHRVIEKMQDAFGADRVIAVALHGGPQSVDNAKGLANPESKEYNKRVGGAGYPKGIIDRQGGLEDFEKWTARVAPRLEFPAKVDVHLEKVVYDESSRQLSFETVVRGLEKLKGNLQVWLTESNIGLDKAPQYFPPEWTDEDKKDFKHNHVFRATVNDLDGDVMELDANQVLVKNYSYTLAEKWQAENMAIVVFYYNAEGVQQVVEVPVINK